MHASPEGITNTYVVIPGNYASQMIRSPEPFRRMPTGCTSKNAGYSSGNILHFLLHL
jgi:hypothetical protein